MDEILWYVKRVPVGGVLAALAVFGLWFLSGSPRATAFVPKLEGLPVREAIDVARRHSFSLRLVVRPGGGRAGTIIEQEPKAGRPLEKNVPITAVVTKGVRQVRLPDITGKNAE